MHSVRREAGAARAAVSFLTRIPLHGAPGDLSRAALWFPAVGALVGALAGAARWASHLVLPRPVATVLALAVAAAVTGALHEDALADTADGLGAHASPARRLEIMRDPRLGSYGTLALVLAVLVAYVALEPLTDARFLRAAVVAHALSRWSSVPQLALMRSADPASSAALLDPRAIGAAAVTLATLAAVLAIAGPVPGAAAAGAAAAATAVCAAAARRALGGITGDTLGAAAKLVELAAYLALAGVWTRHG